MARTAEFEEKEYEQPLNFELLFDRQNLLWSPGQVLEEHFGIDAAMFSGDPRLWMMFGYPDIPNGVILDNFNWGYIWRQVGSRRQLPTFRTNLLLQSKRPEYRVGNNASLAKLGIAGQYWQFHRKVHQQEALEKLHRVIHNRALVCYASPAFHLQSDLFNHITHRTLVDNSTFVQVHYLTNHKKWVYNQAGSSGIACSEMEYISDKPIRELILIASDSNNSNDNILDNLTSLESSSLQVIEELSEINPIKNKFTKRRQRFIEFLSKIDDNKMNSAVRAYWTFSLFCMVTNTTWLPIGRK